MNIFTEASPTSIFQAMIGQENDPPPLKQARSQEPIEELLQKPIAVLPKEWIITPIALDMIALLRTITYTVIPNIDYLGTDSVVNTLRLEHIYNKITSIATDISQNIHQEELSKIKEIFSTFTSLLKVPSFKTLNEVATSLKSLIQEETQELEKVLDFPARTFLVCLKNPPPEQG